MTALHFLSRRTHAASCLAQGLLLGIALLVAMAPATMAQTIANPSFELNIFPNGVGYVSEQPVGTTISGWTASPTNRVGINPSTAGGNSFADNGAVPNGTKVAFIQSDGSASTLSTTITGLVAGTSYRVQFRANRRASLGAPVPSYRLNGGPSVNFNADPAVGASNAYYTVTAIFTATAPTAALEIKNDTPSDSTLLVDNFTITAATPISVTNINDAGAGSLRAALITAASTPVFNVITFAAALNGATITLNSELSVNDIGGVTIDASALSNGITINGGVFENRILNVSATTLMSLRRLTLVGGEAVDANGGAILNAGALSMTQCTLTANSATGPSSLEDGGGGAIQNEGRLDMLQCTVSGNSSDDEGGGIRNFGGTLTLTHCTVSNNTADAGGGITNSSGPLTITNSIIAGNTATSVADDINNLHVTGVVLRVGANIVQELTNEDGSTDSGLLDAIPDDPQLSTLASNGGPTKTMAIAHTSPARNGAVGSTVTTDQRGKPIVNGADLGAFEMQAGTFVLSSSTYKTMEGLPVSITINRGSEVEGTVIVRVITAPFTATSPADFAARLNDASSNVVFGPGETSKILPTPINTVADFIVEGNHTFTTTLSIPAPTVGATLGTPITSTVTIVDPVQATNLNDAGPNSLRQAFATAAANPGPDTIHFAAALNGQVVTLGSEIVVNDADGVTLDGSNLAAGVTIDGGPDGNRIFSVAEGSTLSLIRLTLTGGNGAGATSGTNGGAIYSSGKLTLTRCTLSGNSAGANGGAIFQDSGAGNALTLTQCTLSGNTLSGGNGGAICNFGNATLVHCTITGNIAGLGGGIINEGALTLNRSIVAGNSAGVVADIENTGTLTLEGDSFVTDLDPPATSGTGTNSTADPLLAPLLAANGGPTKTHALLAGSPARDAGGGSASPVTSDQRGLPIVGGTPDVGAYELQTGGVFTLSQTGYSTNEGTAATVTIKRTGGVGAASVRLFTTNGTALAGAPGDYTARLNDASSVVNFNATDSEVTVPPINTTGGDAIESNETFTVTLGTPTGGATIGTPSSATVAIIDESAVSTPLTWDTVNPGVPTISTPLATALVNAKVGDSVTVTGMATDNRGVALVEIRATTPGATPAAFTPVTLTSPGAPTTAFTGTVTPVAGNNSIEVRTTDFAGRTATSVARIFKALRPLVVNVNGNGTIANGFSPSSFREVGLQYAVTATPGSGSMFANWTILSGHFLQQLGVVNSAMEKPTLTFTFREGLVIRANFVSNPYPSLAAPLGTEYLGLVHADGGSPLPVGGTPMNNSTEGLLKITLMSTGAFSGLLTIDGTVLPMSGAFDHTGTARFGIARATTVSVPRLNKPSLVVSATIDLGPSRTKDTISATVTATDFQRSVTTAVSKVEADRAYFDGLTPATTVNASYLGAAGATQAYTVVLPALDNTGLGLAPSDYPQGAGYALVTVTKAGLISITAGKLADGTAVTGSTKLSKENKCPVFLPLYTNKGWLSGDVQLNSALPESDMSSTMLWMRPFDSTKQHYPNGWPEVIDVGFIGARYAATFTPASSVLLRPDGADPDNDIGEPLLPADPELGNAKLTFSQAQLSEDIEKLVNVSTTNVVSKVITNDASYTLTLTPSNGVFTGRFVHELDDGVLFPLMTDFQGVLYQKSDEAGGHGYFLTRQPTPIDYTGESGVVNLIGN